MLAPPMDFPAVIAPEPCCTGCAGFYYHIDEVIWEIPSARPGSQRHKPFCILLSESYKYTPPNIMSALSVINIEISITFKSHGLSLSRGPWCRCLGVFAAQHTASQLITVQGFQNSLFLLPVSSIISTKQHVIHHFDPATKIRIIIFPILFYFYWDSLSLFSHPPFSACL